MTNYIYTKDTNALEVLAVEVIDGDRNEAEAKARTKARKLGKELAGGCFSDDCKPYNFDKMTVIKVRKDTKPYEYKPDRRQKIALVSWDSMLVDDDQELSEILWDDTIESLTELLTAKYSKYSNGEACWKIRGENMGWLHREGTKFIKTKSGKELIAEVLPECECTWHVYNFKNGLMIKNSHHDAPMGEYYYILPISERTFNKEA